MPVKVTVFLNHSHSDFESLKKYIKSRINNIISYSLSHETVQNQEIPAEALISSNKVQVELNDQR